jgi:IMP dehydrogenase
LSFLKYTEAKMSKHSPALTYDDIQLCPSYSQIESRSAIDLSTRISRSYKIKIPLVASPMDTVCDSSMAIALAELGGVGCIHRFMSVEDQASEMMRVTTSVVDYIQSTWNYTVPLMAAVGANGDYLERAYELVRSGANIILIDVAHGHHKLVKDAITALKNKLPSYVDVIAGNIATHRAACDLASWGADALRVGIGGGSLCTTRIKTGFGIPNVTSIISAYKATDIPIIACGGIRSSGDVAKALAVGASSVILGSILAGTKESPGAIIERPDGLYKRYRGAASLETKLTHNQSARNVEGESTVIPFKGGVSFVVSGILEGLRSALSYAGSRNLGEFRPDYVVVSQAGMSEAKPHLI